MPLTSAKDQKKQGAPPPREIVVYCERFGAGPGCGWFVEVSFVEWNHGGFSVFLRTDEDAFGDGYPGQDTLEQDGTDDPERARRVATVEKPLTWRRVLQMLRRLKCLRIADEHDKPQQVL